MGYESRYLGWQSLPAAFFDKAEELGDKPFLWGKSGGAWRPLTWRQAAADVGALSRGLRALGLEPGDRVALVSENRPEWPVADLAIMAAGGITVPAYSTNTVEDHVHILTDSGARLAVVSTAKLAERLLPAVARVGGVTGIVVIEEFDHGPQGVAIEFWDAALARGRAAPDDVAETVAGLGRGDTACLIYTSGTGGLPKGVMLSHGALLHNAQGAYHLFNDSGMMRHDAEVFLSFLPLSHSYEHTAGLAFPLTIGAEIYYAEGAEKLVGNMAEVKPTIMTAVPRLYESMYQRIVAGVQRKGGLSATLFGKAVEIGRKRYRGEPLGLGERLLDPLLDRLVRSKVAARFGGRLKAFVSGGAPLNPDIGTFFLALGVRLLQGYGQTETAPVVSCNPPQRIKIHTVGTALHATEVKTADDGEILVRGELTMQGYWNNPEATAEVLKDGWVHTGDVGRIDEDGYIQITDRKKDIIVLSGGDNVAPQRIEGLLTVEPEINQAMVYGDKRPHLVALLVPDEDFLKSFAKSQGVAPDLATLADDAGFLDAVGDVVDRVNARLSNLEQVRRIALAPEAFTTENAMMTPSLKIRRHIILERLGERVENLYGARKAG